MRSLEAVLLVDFFRRGKAMLPLMLLVIIAVPLWVLITIGRAALNPESREAVVLHVTLTLTIGFLAAVAVLQAEGSITRFFARPISVTRLVTCQMLIGMATIAAMYLIAASLFNLGGASWPLIGPAMFLAATLACALAGIWWFEGDTLAQLCACTATTVPMAVWFNRCYGATIIGDWQTMWRNSTAAEMVTLGAISTAAYVLAIIGVQRVRRGDRWDFSVVLKWIEQWLASESRPTTQFRSPFAAQSWSNWREKIGAAPAVGIACFMLFLVALRWAGYVRIETMLELTVVMPLMVLTCVMPLVFGLVMGDCAQPKGWQMRYLLATRPVTDSLIAGVLLRNAALMLVSAWLTWLVLFALVAGMTYWAGYRAEVEELLTPHAIQFPQVLGPVLLLPLMSWTALSLTLALAATGRQWLWGCTLAVIFSLVIAAAMAKQYIAPALFERLVYGWLLLSGALYLSATTFAFAVAIRKKLLSIPVALAAIAAWAVGSLIAIPLIGPQHQAPLLIWQATGCLSLAILPFAGVPLAVRYCRHR